MLGMNASVAGWQLAATSHGHTTVTAVAGYKCPAANPIIWDQLKPAVDLLVGYALGLKPALVAIAVLLVILLFLCAAFKPLRQKLLEALAWVIGVSIGASILLTIAVAIIAKFGC